jgi:hypothetical protein
MKKKPLHQHDQGPAAATTMCEPPEPPTHAIETLTYDSTPMIGLRMLAFCFASKTYKRKTPHTRLYQPHGGYHLPTGALTRQQLIIGPLTPETGQRSLTAQAQMTRPVSAVSAHYRPKTQYITRGPRTMTVAPSGTPHERNLTPRNRAAFPVVQAVVQAVSYSPVLMHLRIAVLQYT